MKIKRDRTKTAKLKRKQWRTPFHASGPATVYVPAFDRNFRELTWYYRFTKDKKLVEQFREAIPVFMKACWIYGVLDCGHRLMKESPQEAAKLLEVVCGAVQTGLVICRWTCIDVNNYETPPQSQWENGLHEKITVTGGDLKGWSVLLGRTPLNDYLEARKA